MQSRQSRILIVDDLPAIRSSIREILTPPISPADQIDALLKGLPLEVISPYEIYEAGNGFEGVDIAKKGWLEGKPFKVALIDIRMPGISGVETIQLIREFDMDMNIIVISAFSDFTDEQIRDAAKHRVAILAKPINGEQLKTLVTRACTEGL